MVRPDYRKRIADARDRHMVPARRTHKPYRRGLPSLHREVRAGRCQAPTTLHSDVILPQRDIAVPIVPPRPQVPEDPLNMMTLEKLLEHMETSVGAPIELLKISSTERFEGEKELSMVDVIKFATENSGPSVGVDDIIVIAMQEFENFKKKLAKSFRESYDKHYSAHFTKINQGRVNHLELTIQELESRIEELTEFKREAIANSAADEVMGEHRRPRPLLPRQRPRGEEGSQCYMDPHLAGAETMNLPPYRPLATERLLATYSQVSNEDGRRYNSRHTRSHRYSHRDGTFEGGGGLKQRRSYHNGVDDNDDVDDAGDEFDQRRRRHDEVNETGDEYEQRQFRNAAVYDADDGFEMDDDDLFGDREGQDEQYQSRMRGGAGSLEEMDGENQRANANTPSNFYSSTHFPKATTMDAGTQQRKRKILESTRADDSDDDDNIGPEIPSGWGLSAAASTSGDSSSNASRSGAFSQQLASESWASDKTIHLGHYRFARDQQDVQPRETWNFKNGDQIQYSGSSTTNDTAALTDSQHALMASGLNFNSGDLPPAANMRNVVSSRFYNLDELHHSRLLPMTDFEKLNSSIISDELVGATIMPGSVYTPKRDYRLSKFNNKGQYLGGENKRPAKRILKGYKEMAKAREMEIETALSLAEEFLSLDLEDREHVLQSIRRPITYSDDRPPAAPQDITIVDELPAEYSRRAHHQIQTKSIYQSANELTRNTQATSVASYDPSTVDDDFIAGGFDTPHDNGSRRTNYDDHSSRDTIGTLVFRGCARQSSRTSQRTSSSTRDRQGGRISMSSSSVSVPVSTGSLELNIFLLRLKDSPDLQTICDIGSCPELSAHNLGNLHKAQFHAKTYGRVAQVQLHGAVQFSPGAIMARIRGGIIQEVQLFEDIRIALVIYLFPAECRAVVKHFKNVRENGNDMERRALQVEVDWYRAKELSSIVRLSSNIMAEHLASGATRVLRLHRISLNIKKEDLAINLGRALQKLLIKVILCSAKQRYLQEAHDRQAIIEFASIKDAIDARTALLEGLPGFENTNPRFAVDPSSMPLSEQSYCTCKSCKEWRAQRSDLSALEAKTVSAAASMV